jgi:hypothetical protein
METLYRKKIRTTQELFLRLLGEEGVRGPPLTILACTIPTEGAPSLRFLQEPALSLPKGWVAMLRVLFDFVVDT